MIPYVWLQATAGSFAKKTARAATVSTVQRLSDVVVLDDEIEQRIAEEEEEFQEQLKNLKIPVEKLRKNETELQ